MQALGSMPGLNGMAQWSMAQNPGNHPVSISLSSDGGEHMGAGMFGVGMGQQPMTGAQLHQHAQVKQLDGAATAQMGVNSCTFYMFVSLQDVLVSSAHVETPLCACLQQAAAAAQHQRQQQPATALLLTVQNFIRHLSTRHPAAAQSPPPAVPYVLPEGATINFPILVLTL